MSERGCETCGGKRLRPETLAVRIGKKSIADVTACTVREAATHMAGLGLKGAQATIAQGALREIEARLSFLLNVGLDYLTLERSVPSLSGGEAQRIRLASQLGSELSGVMYVLDEPSIGLHQRDNQRLIETLRRLRDLGNTVLVVEHDEATMRAADYIIELGPGAGQLGGKITAQGTPAEIAANPNSITGGCLSDRVRIEAKALPQTLLTEPLGPRSKHFLTIHGATEHNLRNVTATFPVNDNTTYYVAVDGALSTSKGTYTISFSIQ